MVQKIDFKNLEKLKTELSKLTSVENFKSEIHKITKELKSFDLKAHLHLGPQATQNLKKMEIKYKEVVSSLNRAQKQFEQELKKAMSLIKKTRSDVEKKLNHLRKTKVGQKGKKKVSKKTGTRKKSGSTKKKTSSTTPSSSTHNG